MKTALLLIREKVPALPIHKHRTLFVGELRKAGKFCAWKIIYVKILAYDWILPYNYSSFLTGFFFGQVVLTSFIYFVRG